jgi:hypothetical protein
MDKNCYQEIIEEVSRKLSDKIMSEEKNLPQRATLIDRDIANIVQDIGLKTCKQVLEKTRNQIVEKKNKKD